MSDTTASFDDLTVFGGRELTLDLSGLMRSLLGSAATGVAATAAISATVAVATVSGLWMVGVALNGSPHWQARAPAGPARLALVDSAAFPPTSFEAKWAPTNEAIATQARLAAIHAPLRQVAAAAPKVPAPRMAARSELKVKHEAARKADAVLAKIKMTPAPVQVAKLAPASLPPARSLTKDWLNELTPPAGLLPPPPQARVARTAPVPLPKVRPVIAVVARAPVAAPTPEPVRPATRLAVIPPPAPAAVEKRTAPREAHIKGPALPGPDSRTALYDISGHTVYMPDGTRLEAHSGLGYRIDNPRFVKVRMLGPTPPNVYDLTLRQQLFHGVRAVRLNPVYGSRMFGRDGMLAHTYMLGPNGQSNGCVSFKHYRRFLQAFLDGKVDRMVVVRNLDDAPAQLANLARARGVAGERYAAATTSSDFNW